MAPITSLLRCISARSSIVNASREISMTAHLRDPSKVTSLDPNLDRRMKVEWSDGRQVRISKPSKNVMQSGTANTKMWKMEFNSQPRWENWLMGWTSTADPVSNLTLNFPTKEDAIAYCDKNKLNWFVEEQPERKIRRKSYADNFSWNKRTRTGNK